MRRTLLASLVLIAPLAVVSCGADGVTDSSSSGGATGTGGAGGAGPSSTTTSTSDTTTSTSSAGGSGGVGGMGGAGGAVASTTAVTTSTTTSGSGGMGGGPATCDSIGDDDADMDGFTVAQGDCNDCDANVNPGAIEVIISEPGPDGVIPPPADEDCDGVIDNVAPPCDTGIAVDDFDAKHGAHAIDLCQDLAPGNMKWGILASTYVRADGTPAAVSNAVGIQPGFGPNVAPKLGQRMLVLSSGRARLPGQPFACNSGTCYGYGAGTPPPGFPQDVPNCPGDDKIKDDVALEVTLRSPTNATGYSFWFDFYTFEYAEWVCSSYNDQFIALVSPPPDGSINGNISFDSQANPVSVNIAFFDVCAGCALGTSQLVGTGFDGSWNPNHGGATGWLRTTAPVTGGDNVTIRFTIWDTGDQAYDSTALVDGFEWIANGGTVVVQTNHM